MIYVHDTIKFRLLVKLPISFLPNKSIHEIYEDKWLNCLILSITIYSPEIIIIIYDSNNKVFKVLIELKRKMIETAEPARWNIIKVEKLKREKYEIKLSI